MKSAEPTPPLAMTLYLFRMLALLSIFADHHTGIFYIC